MFTWRTSVTRVKCKFRISFVRNIYTYILHEPRHWQRLRNAASNCSSMSSRDQYSTPAAVIDRIATCLHTLPATPLTPKRT